MASGFEQGTSLGGVEARKKRTTRGSGRLGGVVQVVDMGFGE